jgi:hypothetical protein
MVVLMLAPQAFVPGVGRVRIALLVGAFAIAAHCWTRFAAGLPLSRPTREMRIIGALLLLAMVTLPLSLSPSGSIRILLGDFLKALGVFWLVSNTVNTLGRLRTMAWTLSLAVIPLAVSGVGNFLSQNFVSGRIASYDAPLTGDPNALAMVLNVTLPLTVGLFLITRRPMIRTVLAGLIALFAGAIIVTFSRGGFLALASTFVLYLRTLREWGKWMWAVAALVLAIAAIPLLPPGYLDRLGTITNIKDDETGSAQERWELTRVGLAYAIRHPVLGAGLGMNFIASCPVRRLPGAQSEKDCVRACYAIPPQAPNTPPPYPPCLYVHNVYLQYAMDLGWPGLGLFLLLLVSCLGSAARVRERCRDLPALRDLASLAEAIRIMIVAFAVSAFFYPWAYYVYFYYAAAVAVATGAVYETEVRAGAVTAAPVQAARPVAALR